MDAIGLDEQQKAKLLEMCKVLFPQYKFQFGSGSGDCGGWSYDYLYHKDSQDPNNDFAIHWFEFCSTHLLEKLLRSAGADFAYYMDTVFGTFSIGWLPVSLDPTHPVDWLYSKYLEYK